jgi:membrane-associated phospholipid phosphatase
MEANMFVQSTLPLDIVLWLQSLENWFFDLFFNAVSFLGEEYFYIAVIGLVYWTLNKRFGEFLGITLGASITFNNVAKEFFESPRPFTESSEVINKRPGTSSGHSMPSGHVQGSSTFFFSIAFFSKVKGLLITSIIITILMMLSRMYLGVHYIQDVIVGAVIGITIAVVMYYFFDKYKENEKQLHRFYFIIAAIFLPAFIFLMTSASANDFFKGYAILIGFIAGVIFEKRYVKFTIDIPYSKKVIRYVLGLISMILVLTVFGQLFGLIIQGNEGVVKNLFDFVRYFLVAFVGFGAYPWVFQRFNF